MSTIVWVMMVFSQGSQWIPTLEFTTEQKCVAAANTIKAQVDPTYTLGSMRQPFCVRIEK
jgi:hypothetical protein